MGLVAIRYMDSEKVTQLGLAELRGARIEQQDFLRADLCGLDLSGAAFRDCGRDRDDRRSDRRQRHLQ